MFEGLDSASFQVWLCSQEEEAQGGLSLLLGEVGTADVSCTTLSTTEGGQLLATNFELCY